MPAPPNAPATLGLEAAGYLLESVEESKEDVEGKPRVMSLLLGGGYATLAKVH